MAVFKKNKTWYIDYYFEGKRKREAVGSNKKMAEHALAKRKLQIAKKRYLNMTLRYSHLSATHKRKAMESLRFSDGHYMDASGNSGGPETAITHCATIHAGVVEQVDARDLKSLGA